MTTIFSDCACICGKKIGILDRNFTKSGAGAVFIPREGAGPIPSALVSIGDGLLKRVIDGRGRKRSKTAISTSMEKAMLIRYLAQGIRSSGIGFPPHNKRILINQKISVIPVMNKKAAGILSGSILEKNNAGMAPNNPKRGAVRIAILISFLSGNGLTG
jgi:hypothetical protein